MADGGETDDDDNDNDDNDDDDYAEGGKVGAVSKTKIQITDGEEGRKIATRTLIKENKNGERKKVILKFMLLIQRMMNISMQKVVYGLKGVE